MDYRRGCDPRLNIRGRDGVGGKTAKRGEEGDEGDEGSFPVSWPEGAVGWPSAMIGAELNETGPRPASGRRSRHVTPAGVIPAAGG